MITRKELEAKFQTWAEVAGFSTVRDEEHTHCVWLEHRSYAVYGPKVWRVAVIGPDGGTWDWFDTGYLTTSEMWAALSLAINTVYQGQKRIELRK